MLHYPFYLKDDESLEDRQHNLIHHCISKLDPVHGKVVLDVGAGNGCLGIYTYDNYTPEKIIGIDINEQNLAIAKNLRGDRNIELKVDNAEQMLSIPDNSVDVVMCIESAFHYPNKGAFLKQLFRVLKDDGQFIIADIITNSYKKRPFIGRWKRKMNLYHWTEKDYAQAIINSGFSTFEVDDITREIIRGYKGYLGWVKELSIKNIIGKIRYQLITFVQVNMCVYLLKKRRKYLVFIGNKV